MDILECIEAIEGYTADLTYDQFAQSQLVQDGVVRRLEIIGEATKHIPKHVRDQYPAIPWREMTGMRDILAHDYYGVILDNTWNVVVRDLPPLKAALEEVRRSID